MVNATLSEQPLLEARPYQEEGVDWLVNKRKGILADSPGLGKTFQSAEAAWRSHQMPALISAPAHLVGQWAKFLVRQYPGTRVAWSNKNHYLYRQKALDDKLADWYITSHSMLQQPKDWNWPVVETVIFDESHHLKNRRSHQSRGARYLVNERKDHLPTNVFELTATPVRREFDDMYHQLHLLDPEMFSSYQTFVDTFCVEEKNPWGGQVIGIQKDSMEALRRLLKVYMLRRTYKEVGMFLPDIMPEHPDNIIEVEMTEAEMKTYKRLRDEYVLQLNQWGSEEEVPFFWAMEVMQGLRQLTCTSEKLKTTVELAEDLPKPVIFTWYKHSAEILAGMLKVKPITGEVKAITRSDLANSQEVVVATIGSINEGVDLSGFGSVIFFEEDHTPGPNYQAISRVARFGFEEGQPLLCYYVHCKDTIDGKIHRKTGDRAQTIREVIQEVLI